jgi:predicted ATPase
MQNHDEMSWNLTNRILKRIRNLFVIGVVRSDELETAEKTDMVERGIKTIAAIPDITTDTCILGPLDYSEIEKLLKRILEERQPSDDLIRFVLDRSEGNPLAAVDLLDNLLKQGMLQYLNNEVFANDLLKKFIRLQQYIEIMVPSSRLKINGLKLDQIDFNHYNLLKAACAIGNTFDLKTIVVSNPFYHSLIPPKDILNYLNELRQFEILDLVDDSSKNLVYRFSTPFLRETLYQRIPFNLRRGLHRSIAESWQNTEDPLENEFILYQWNLSDPESDF